MKPGLYLLLFVVLPYGGFGQKPVQSFDKALQKLTNKTWARNKCINGSCKTVDSDYFIFPISFLEKRGTLPNKNCVKYLNYKYKKTPGNTQD
jgi:hypothetical protein